MQGNSAYAAGGVEQERKAESCDWPYQVSNLRPPCSLCAITASLGASQNAVPQQPMSRASQNQKPSHVGCHDDYVACLSLDGGTLDGGGMQKMKLAWHCWAAIAARSQAVYLQRISNEHPLADTTPLLNCR